jgi:hypothetical protein
MIDAHRDYNIKLISAKLWKTTGKSSLFKQKNFECKIIVFSAFPSSARTVLNIFSDAL